MAFPQIPVGFGLVLHMFTDPDGVGHSETSYGVGLNGTPTATQVATELDGYAATHLMDFISTHLVLAATKAIINTAGTITEGLFSSNTAGLSTGDDVPPQVSFLAKKLTGAVGRGFRGRMYIPGVRVQALQSNSAMLLNTPFATFQTDLDAFLTAITGGTHVDQMVLFHANTSPLHGTSQTVTKLLAEQQVATQRRRNRKASHH